MNFAQHTLNRKERVTTRARHGIIFTFDALLGSVLIIAALLLVLNHQPTPAPITQTTHYAQDAIRALNALTIREVNLTANNTWLATMIANGNISDPDVSLLDQIGVFWATNETTAARNLTTLLFTTVLPPGFGLSFSIEGSTFYNTTGTGAERQRAAGRRMLTGVQEGEQLRGSTSAAYLRRIQAKTTNAYAYFGGFTGQGDVTVRLDDLPSDLNETNVQLIRLEGEFDSNFTLYLNGDQCNDEYAGSSGDLVIQSYDVTNCSDLLDPGNNTVELRFTGGVSNASVSGGFLRVGYQTSTFQETMPYGEKTTWLPDVDGVINVYDAFYTPGSLQNLSITLHYWVVDNSTLPIYFDIGNKTVFTFNDTGEQTYTLNDAYLRSRLNYTLLSNNTIPYRFGFYDGNTTNASGNVTDAFLLTSRHHSMDENDIVVNETTNRTRLAQVKNVDSLFVNTLLNATGNRVGLVSFGTGASIDLDSELTDDNATLQGEIAAYAAHPTDAQRYLCGAMETAKAELVSAGGARKRAVLLMTDGNLMKATGNTPRCAAGPTKDEALVWEDAVAQACDFSDPVHGNPENITFYTVAFGPNATSDPAITANLTLMANCTGGKFASGTNASELEAIYQLFAEELAASSITFSFQRAVSAQNVESHLYGDSTINAVYDPIVNAPGQYQIPITLQTGQFGSCTPNVHIPPAVSVTEATLASYSGDYWTRLVTVDGSTVFNLSTHALTYAALGDPFLVNIPANLLTSGDHTLDISIGANSTHDAGCSLNDSLVYQALVNASTGRTSVLPVTTGCNWQVEFEDLTTVNVSVPDDYSGAKNCSYTSASISYNNQDAYDAAVYALLAKLDFDGDGRVFINLAEEDLEIVVTLVEQVPYLWGPAMATVEVSR